MKAILRGLCWPGKKWTSTVQKTSERCMQFRALVHSTIGMELGGSLNNSRRLAILFVLFVLLLVS